MVPGQFACPKCLLDNDAPLCFGDINLRCHGSEHRPFGGMDAGGSSPVVSQSPPTHRAKPQGTWRSTRTPALAAGVLFQWLAAAAGERSKLPAKPGNTTGLS